MDLWHNVKRFFGSLRPGPPPRADLEWAEGHLLPAEVDLWRLMSNPDKRHALRVARRVEVALGHEATRPVMAAALLHDVGHFTGVHGAYAPTDTRDRHHDEAGRDWLEENRSRCHQPIPGRGPGGGSRRGH